MKKIYKEKNKRSIFKIFAGVEKSWKLKQDRKLKSQR
jgi:hypothetical protein